jgi:hypothetical protein
MNEEGKIRKREEKKEKKKIEKETEGAENVTERKDTKKRGGIERLIKWIGRSAERSKINSDPKNLRRNTLAVCGIGSDVQPEAVPMWEKNCARVCARSLPFIFTEAI